MPLENRTSSPESDRIIFLPLFSSYLVTEAIHGCACYIKMNPEAVEDASNDVMKIILDSKLALFTSDKVKYKTLFSRKKIIIELLFSVLGQCIWSSLQKSGCCG